MVKKPFYIVALGASAGGHEALWEYFEHIPTHLPVSYVVILHLKADVNSIADKLLAKYTDIPVQWATDALALQPNQIYLLPPAKYMTLLSGKFQLTDRDPEKKMNQAIDIFFGSLAKDWGGYSVGIVLSGAGSDGTMGSLQLHVHRGVIMAQDPKSAIIDSMPESAIMRDHVQLALPPKQLAQALAQLVEQANGGPLNFIGPLSLKDSDQVG